MFYFDPILNIFIVIVPVPTEILIMCSLAYQVPDTLDALLGTFPILASTAIPVEFMSRYCNGRGNGSSEEAAQEINSSTMITSVNGGKKMNQFQYSSLPLEDRPSFMSFQFNEQQLETFVFEKFRNCSTIVEDLALKLTHLRSIIYRVAIETNEQCWSETRIQAFMALFLNSTFEAVNCNLRALDANRIPISYVTSDGVTWNGYSDLMCCDPTSRSLESAAATIEMKVPIRSSDPRLFHSKALKPKQQLLCQALALLDNRTHTLSYLTDIFAISVMYYVEGKACLSARVTDAKLFCIRLLLMCIDVSAEEWASLLSPHEMVAVNLEEEDDEAAPNNVPHVAVFPSSKVAKESSSSAPRTRSQSGKRCDNVAKIALSFVDEEEAHSRRLSDFTNYQHWEAKVLGHTYFGIKELRQHNELHENLSMNF
jgi:hypothetical protein